MNRAFHISIFLHLHFLEFQQQSYLWLDKYSSLSVYFEITICIIMFLDENSPWLHINRFYWSFKGTRWNTEASNIKHNTPNI